MAYKLEGKDIVINGWEQGIAETPYNGIADMRNIDIISFPGEAMVNYSEVAVTVPPVMNAIAFTAQNTGDTITKLGVLSPGTTVVGFGTTSFDIEVWDYASGTFISSSTSAPSLIISSAAVGTATTTFTVGLSSEFPSLLLDQPTNVAATNTFFTVIRTTQAVLDRFDATNNPVDPVTIAILSNNTLGLGHTLVRVNNGSPAGPFQWREVLGEFAPEPACGNGFSRYYPGNNSWPGFTTRQYSSAGVSVASTFYYATETPALLY